MEAFATDGDAPFCALGELCSQLVRLIKKKNDGDYTFGPKNGILLSSAGRILLHMCAWDCRITSKMVGNESLKNTLKQAS